MTKIGTLALLALFTVVGCGNAGGRQERDIASSIVDAAETMVEKPLIRAVSIGVVYRGEEFIVHRGELEDGKKNPPDNETLYEVGSLSKTFAGTLVAKAVLEKKVDLDDDIRKYLPESYPNLAYNDEPIRVKHLLSHTSGLPNMLPLEASVVLQDFTRHSTPGKLNDVYKGYGQANFLKDLHAVKITASPGHTYSYSSVGTELTARMLESVYGVGFESLLVDYFSGEAGMANTRIVLNDEAMRKLAPGYHSDNAVATSAMPKLPWGASGNVKSTVPDMMKYIKFHLGGNRIASESHKEIVKFDADFGIAYFWNINTGNQKLGTYYSHHGGVPRSQCYVYLVPKYDLGIFIITNQSGEKTASVMEQALDEILGVIVASHKN